jgi:hypothetical protein
MDFFPVVKTSKLQVVASLVGGRDDSVTLAAIGRRIA